MIWAQCSRSVAWWCGYARSEGWSESNNLPNKRPDCVRCSSPIFSNQMARLCLWTASSKPTACLSTIFLTMYRIPQIERNSESKVPVPGPGAYELLDSFQKATKYVPDSLQCFNSTSKRLAEAPKWKTPGEILDFSVCCLFGVECVKNVPDSFFALFNSSSMRLALGKHSRGKLQKQFCSQMCLAHWEKSMRQTIFTASIARKRGRVRTASGKIQQE